ncbi:MAG TPA: heme o synthase [Burkholderiales bacterium]|nr:heme o synthase [Burkholderiales bacterium]
MNEQALTLPLALGPLLRLGKPRVVSLIVFTAIIGMFLAAPGLPPAEPLLFGAIGIALVATSAAALNCVIEQKLDAIMARTRARPLPGGEVTTPQALVFIGCTGLAGLLLLNGLVNALTMWLTLATLMGYAVIYTIVLKPRTPQNIVIGGASGAMPPVLGWCAVTGEVSVDALLLFLIIFAWTPPHFWSLALYRRKEYARAGVPMLPVTHGERYTRLNILIYTVILAAICLTPFVSGMSGWIYLLCALFLNAVFVVYAVRLYANYSDQRARRMFRYSITYLFLIFAALLVDHYWHVG